MTPRPPALPAALDHFETALADGGAIDRLRQIGAPPFVGFLFRLEARRRVKMGPRVDPSGPADLLRAAQEAARSGVAPVSAPVAVRRLLAEAAEEVRRVGAWRRDRPFWWQPLPRPSRSERLWGRLERSWEAAFPPDGLVVARDHPWRWLPGVLPAELCSALFRRLEGLHARGTLTLEQGRVGSGGGGADARADEVRLLTGYEGDLLRQAPPLGVLVQWCLEQLAPSLARSSTEQEVFPPRSVMLARYPGPSTGFRSHLDNPGGMEDNGRARSCVLYLNPEDAPSAGGELALWRPGADPSAPPDEVLRVGGGSLALFDARTVHHEVRPLGAGPPRWTLVVWLNEVPQRRVELPPLPRLSATDVLLSAESPPVPRGKVLRHELDEGIPGKMVAGGVGARSRAGIVCTVRGEGEGLEPWCRHHLEVGFEHLVLVFDDLEDSAEAALAVSLRASFPPSRLTIWSTAGLRKERWERSSRECALGDSLAIATEGASPQAVACRQTLNATAALQAAKTDELGGTPLDWLVHLDGDELFYPQGRGRGGETAEEHFAALSAAGIELVRYVNHELLLSSRRGAGLRFKRNPRLAAARLGRVGWSRLVDDLRMGPEDRRPYFHGYRNGKSAVAVASGRAAAGVHGWMTLGASVGRQLAGPSVLHFHLATIERLVRKLLAMAAADDVEGEALFEPCRTEKESLELVRGLLRAGVGEPAVRTRLEEHRAGVTGFSSEEEEILEAAGLVLKPELSWPLPVDPAGGGGKDGAGGRSGGCREDDRQTRNGGRPAACVDSNDRVPALGQVRSVGILGGGTAGHLAALTLRRKRPEIDVTLIESRQIPVIGVGEATTPLMPQFLHADLGLEVEELFTAVCPTLKLGIVFDWELAGSGSFPYPFGPLRLLEPPAYDGSLAFLSLWATMMAAGKVPFLESGPEGAPLGPGVEIAYHLDNRRFVEFLRRAAREAGVRRVECMIEGAERTADGTQISELVSEDGRRFAFDVYLDCSGFRSCLLGQALDTPFVSYAESLFTDSAIVASVPHGGEMMPFTRAQKMSSGWCWTTPQRREDHLGYVFSSRFTTAEAAWQELRRRHPGARRQGLVRFASGRRSELWKGNVFALGNAYGFVEPLESTALHMLIRELGVLLRILSREPDGGLSRDQVNRSVAAWWDYLAWFLALHYRFDPEPASPFWKACARQVDVSRHQELLEAFDELGPLSVALPDGGVSEAPDPLWGPEGIDLILLGQGRTGSLPWPSMSRAAWDRRVRSWRALTARAPSQATLLRRTQVEPRPLATLERAFQERGAAFA